MNGKFCWRWRRWLVSFTTECAAAAAAAGSKMNICAVLMEEKLHQGQCQGRLIVSASSNCCMEETATGYTSGCVCIVWMQLYGVTCGGRGRMVNKQAWAATPRKGHHGSFLCFLLHRITAITNGKGKGKDVSVYKMMISNWCEHLSKVNSMPMCPVPLVWPKSGSPTPY